MFVVGSKNATRSAALFPIIFVALQPFDVSGCKYGSQHTAVHISPLSILLPG